MAINRKTTPPQKEVKKEESPKVKTTTKKIEGTVTDVGTALADIQKRADARKKIVDVPE